VGGGLPSRGQGGAGWGGFGGGGAVGRAGQSAAPALLGAGAGSAAMGSGASGPTTVRTVLNVGRKTFFWRQERWEDSTLTEEHLQHVRKIERYSSEYFDMVERFGKEFAQYLAVDETVVVVLDDTAYEF
jgi:Ca-activated chloride channel family protein